MPPDDAPLVEPSACLTPPGEIERRLAGLRATLVAKGLDAAVVVQNADLYYFSGTVQQSFLYVPHEGTATLFARRVVERARRESPLPDVVALSSVRDLPAMVARRYGRLPKRLGLESDVLPVVHFRRLEALFPDAVTVDVGPDIVRQRAVKSPWEVERIRAAAAIADGVFRCVPDLLDEGVSEAEFAGRVEAEARRLGHEGIIRMRGFNQEMFYGQLLTGVSGAAATFLATPLGGTGLSPAVAQGVSFKPIGRGEPVVFDFVAVRNGYIADFTRMVVIGGLTDELARAYDAALAVQQAVEAVARPGVTCGEVWETAFRAAATAGLDDRFMGHGAARVRFVGHGVGLELDELPVLSAGDDELAEGMVFALEPKFVLPGLGAVGVEDTYVVTAEGIAPLTTAPRHVVELAP